MEKPGPESKPEVIKEWLWGEVRGASDKVCDRLVALWPFVVLPPNGVHPQWPVVEFAGFLDEELHLTYNTVVCQLGERKFCIRLCLSIEDGTLFIVERTVVEAIKLLSIEPPLPRETWRALREFVGRYLSITELKKLIPLESA